MDYFECETFDEAYDKLKELKKTRNVEGYSFTKDPSGPWWLGVVYAEDI